MRQARSTALTRLICPAPTPTKPSFLASTMPFDFTCLTALQANWRSVSSSSVGCRDDTTCHPAVDSDAVLQVCTRKPPSIRLKSRSAYGIQPVAWVTPGSDDRTLSSLMDFLRDSTWTASGV